MPIQTLQTLGQLWKHEFGAYSRATFRQDLLAGLTVGAVSLPLALAFGVASGATPAAGLVTAIVAGLVIGALSGSAYQISGPTGAMSAVLLVLAQKYGLTGVWVAGGLAGLLLLVIGLLRLGRFIAFIPAPVITGFTSGIALIIAIGQLDNLLGIATPAADSAALKLLGYLRHGRAPDWHALLLGLLVMATMVFWPRRWGARLPASLLGLVLATALSSALGWQVDVIGAIPQTILLSDRLSLAAVPWANLGEFIAPALTITALGAVESLLCGAVASTMTGTRLHASLELIAQGIGNLVIPFLGGVPATAAIARTSVGIKAGGQTRMVSIIHALALLASVLVLTPVMSRIPLAALAGVLLVTAWRMNEWEALHYFIRHRFKAALITFAITMVATVTLDLTQAILAGVVVSAAVFLSQAANITIVIQNVDWGRLRRGTAPVTESCREIKVAYLAGALFFAAVSNFNEAFANLDDTHVLILSLRGLPLIDASGLQAVSQLHERLRHRGGTLMLAAVQESVRDMLDRGGLLARIGPENVFWGADEAILAADQRGCSRCAAIG
jgi:sulfate permease, SulP family